MDFFSLLGLILVACAIGVLIRTYRPDMYVPFAVAVGAVILFVALGQFHEVSEQLLDFANQYGVKGEYITAAFKVTGVACLTQFASNICRDMGESAIAGKAELAGKVMILCIAMPVILSVFGVIASLMGGA